MIGLGNDSGLQLYIYSSYQAISSRIHFDDPGHAPLGLEVAAISEHDQVIHLKVAILVVPLCGLLQVLEVLLGPPVPEFLGCLLANIPSLQSGGLSSDWLLRISSRSPPR